MRKMTSIRLWSGDGISHLWQSQTGSGLLADNSVFLTETLQGWLAGWLAGWLVGGYSSCEGPTWWTRPLVNAGAAAVLLFSCLANRGDSPASGMICSGDTHLSTADPGIYPCAVIFTFLLLIQKMNFKQNFHMVRKKTHLRSATSTIVLLLVLLSCTEGMTLAVTLAVLPCLHNPTMEGEVVFHVISFLKKLLISSESQAWKRTWSFS